jgi:hypothetical protein
MTPINPDQAAGTARSAAKESEATGTGEAPPVIDFGASTVEQAAEAVFSHFGKIGARDVLVALSDVLDASGGY